ncbi:MAG: hypothetical protein ACLSAQ_05630 [[Eubacterium] siraeum]|jgi:hypothetical protein
MMTPAEENRVCELTEKIVRLKKHLTENSARMTNADAFDKLEKIGELLSEKNALTGLHEDAAYLYLDDGEWFREVKGFVGDDSGMHDCTGITLKIGDTVSLNGYPRLIMQDMPSQKTLLECGCKKIKDCSEMDIQDGFSCAFTVSLRSCLEDYENSLQQGMEMRL